MDKDFIRRSADARKNAQVLNTEDTLKSLPRARRSNVAWFRAQKIKEGVLLLGGTTVDHFRIRVAQSRYRDDLAPSFWSMAGIIGSNGEFLTVPLDTMPSVARVATVNGVHLRDLREFDDAEQYPNIAVLSFAHEMNQIADAAKSMAMSRALADFPSMMIPWLGYIWATDASSNPLRSGIGLPSAVLVEAAHAAERIHISPGQASSSSAPEAIWQGAVWWTRFYAEATKVEKLARQPAGSYLIRQWAAAARGVRDDVSAAGIQPVDRKGDERWKHEWRSRSKGRRGNPLR
jgi:hypothetical protein